ncbi:muscle M-line assembly protein unc-89-like isoform X2 [Lineus longissimus]|uniref:muscle M-line assembly protein unc-89-like isoform X2 n=1 Tax=Lineus longissimus TaxID=88925 RepID=UPI00315DEECA
MILAWLWLFITGIAFLISLLCLIGEWRRRDRVGTEERAAPVLSDIMPRQEEATQGSYKRFECQVTGTPQPEVTWYKDDIEITNDPRFQFSLLNGAVSCLIRDVKPDDAGCYTCRAENSEGSALTAAFLSIRDVSEIVEEGECFSEKANEQEAATGFQDRLSSKPRSSIDHEGVPEIARKDARSQSGSLEDFVDAFVDELLGKPQGGVSNEDDEIFSQGRLGPETDGVQLKTDALALGAGSPRREAEELQRLLALAEDGFASAENLGREAEDGGRKLKQTDSETGEVRTDSFGFGDKPAIVMEIPANICVKEGETITIKCRIAAFPKPDVSWFKDGEPIRPDERHVIKIKDDMFSLEVRDSEAIDAGEYTITAINQEGKIYYNVRVEVLEKGTEKGARGKAVRKPPEFVEKPASMTVTEFEQLKLWCVVSGAPAPSVTWFREGKVLKDDGRTDIYNDGDKHYLLVTKAFLRDAGEYTCTANNAVGAVFCSVYVTVEGATEGESGASTDYDLAVIEKLSPLIYEEIAKIQDEPTDEELFREYLLKTAYTDIDKEIILNEGEVIEVLDQENPELWLVRKQDDRRKICKVPSNLLKPKTDSDKTLSPQDEVRPALARMQEARMQELTVQDAAGDSPDGLLTPERRRGKLSRSPSKRTASSEGGDSSEDEDKQSKVEQYPVYIAIAEYTPPESEKDAPKLTEGQFVYVLDSKNPDRWYIQTKPTKTNPSKQGWVPPCFLDKKAGSGYIDKRSTREIFREDIIQITNKQTEALMKRRYALTELLETERDYVKELKLALDQFESLFKETGLPGELVDKKELLLANLKDLHHFHNDVFLSELMTCTNDPNGIGESFMKMESKFNEYIPYLKGRPGAEILLSQPRSKKALEKFERKSRLDTQCDMQNSLRKPRERLRTYEALLKDLLRYTSRAGEKVPRLEDAIAMVMKIPQNAEDRLLLESIEEFPGDLLNMGNLIRHDDFIVWDAEAVGRGRDRHCLLFPDKIVMVKCKRPASHTDLPTYTYKGTINVPDVQINELVVDDEKFELWYAVPNSEKVTFEARNVHNKQAWVMDLRQLMRDLGVEETDLPLNRIPEVQMKYTSSPLPRKKLSVQEPKADLFLVPDSDKGTDYNTAIDSYESDISTQDTSSYHTALDYDYENITKPVYMKKLRKMRATEGDAVKFECVVVGNPAPDITWLKDSVPLSESSDVVIQSVGDRHSVVVRDVLRDDRGIYTVSAANEHGTTDCSAQLLVCSEGMDETSQMTSDGDYGTAASIASEEGNSEIEATTPRLIGMPPEVMDIRLGGEARIDCSVIAYPEADIIWLKNGKEVLAKDRYKFLFVDDDTYSLVIQDSQPEDTGLYTCIARNKHGECKADVKLTVSEHRVPSFTKHLEDTRVIEGEKVQLECCVDGNPEPDFAWLCNDEIILPSEDFLMRFDGEACTFIIKEAFPEDAGIYTCQMTNSAGTAETRARLTVDREETEIAPDIARGFQDLTVEQGTACSFECDVTGSPIPEVTWSFNGEKVKSAGNIKLSQDNERYGLSIVKASQKEIGEYSCTATNKVGTAKCAAQLIVKEQEIAPKIVKGLEDISVAEGKGCTLECTINGKPQPEVVWMLNGKKIESSTNIKQSQDKDRCTLTITKASPKESGEYSCTAKNQAGSVTCAAKLTVKEAGIAPKIEKGFEDLIVDTGKSCAFKCSISGKPSSDVTWAFNGKQIKAAENIKLSQDKDTYSLTIAKCTLKDTGEYTCTAKNNIGSASCVAKLKVMEETKREKPIFATKPSDCEVADGKTAKFVCTFKDKPKTVQWLKDGKELKPSTHFIMELNDNEAKLMIDNAALGDSGNYTCVAVNDSGKIEATAELRVGPPPPDDTSPAVVFEEIDCEAIQPVQMMSLESMALEPLIESNVNTQMERRPDDKVQVFIAPNKLKYTEIDPETIRLTWEPAETVVNAPMYYNIDFRESTIQTWQPLVHGLAETTYTVNNLDPKKSYVFRVASQTEYGISHTSPELTMPTRAVPTVAEEETVFDVASANLETVYFAPYPEFPNEDPPHVIVNKDSVTLKWEEAKMPPGKDQVPTFYDVEGREGERPDWTPVAEDLTDTEYTVGGLRPDEEYEFRVQPKNEHGPGKPTKPVKVPRRGGPPRFLTTIPEYEELGPDAVKISWQAADVPKECSDLPVVYSISMKEEVAADFTTIIKDLKKTNLNITDLEPSKAYCFRIQASNEFGPSETCIELTIPERAVPMAPVFAVTSPPTLTKVEKQEIVLSWSSAEIPKDAIITPISYTLQAKESTVEDWKVVADNVKDTTAKVKSMAPDKEYLLRVMAKNEFGESEPTKSVTLAKRAGPPEMPSTAPKCTEKSPETVDLTWSAATTTKGYYESEITYTVEVREESVTAWKAVEKGVAITTATVSSLEPNKAYAMQVTAQNEYGSSKPTDEVKLPVRGVLGAPEWETRKPPKISNNKDGTLKLSWSNATLPAGAKPTKITYTVEMQEGSEDWITLVDGLPDTQFNVKGADPKVNTSYRIQAANEFGRSEPSEAAEIHRSEALPEFPTDEPPSVLPLGKDSVKLTWPAATLPSDVPFCPTLYNIEEKSEEEEAWSSVVEDVAETEYTIKGVRPDRECLYRVHPKNKHGFGRPTKAKRVPRRAGPPNLLPTIPEYDEIAPDAVELTWKPAETPKEFIDAPVQYTVEMKDEVSPDWQVIAKDLSDPTFTVQDLEPSMKYQFRIQASNEYGPSESCMELELPTRKIPMPPQFSVLGKPKLSKVEAKTPVLSWAPADTPVGGRDSPITYTVEAKEKDGKEWTPIVDGVKDTNCKVDGVKPDKEYELRVQAKNEFGASEPTEPVVLPKRAGPPELPENALTHEEKQPDTIELKWKKAQTTKGYLECPITYNIEMREETSQKWATLVKGIAKTTCRIADLEPNLAYVFRVTALNEYGQSQPTEELLVKERTKPLPPNITNKKPPTVSDVKDNSLTLSWDGAETPPDGKPSPMTYTIETKDCTDGKWRPLVEGLQDTNFNVDGVNPDTEYSYRVKAKNEFGESEPSDAVNVAKRAGPPLMPEAEPEYSEVNTESVTVSWKPAETAKGFLESPITYNIEIREESATEWNPLVQDVAATTYTADHLEPSKAYVFRVTAKNQFGESDHCKDLHVPDRLVAVPPQFLSDEPPNPSKLESDSLTLTWLNADVPKDSKPSTITYTVEAKEGAGDWKPVATKVKDTTHRVTGVKPDEDIEFRVKAENEFGSSEPTKIAKVEKRAGPPQMKDTTPKFAEASPKEVELSWDAATDTKGYLKSPITYSIEIKEESVGEWKPLVKGVAKAAYTVTDLDPKKAFEFKISAQNEYGTSEVCQQVKVPDRMKPMPPKTSTKVPEISKLDDNSLEMAWPAPEMPAEAKPSPITYDIEEKDSKGNWKPVAKDLKDTQHKIEGVAPDKEHEYRVQAKNEFGNGEPTKPLKVEKRAGPPVMKKAGKPEFSEINPETIELSWDAAADEKGYIKAPITYDIEMREESTKEFKPIVMDLAKTTFKVSDLEPSKAFVFKVTAKNEFGPSEVCQELKVPDRLKPLPPAMSSDAPQLEKVDKDSVKIAWSPAEFPKHAKPSKVSYTVEEKDGSSWKPLAEDLKDAGTSVKGLAPDKEHELRVVAKNEFGTSEPTQSVKVDKCAGPPVMKKATPKFKEVNPETVELSWEAATGEKGHIKVPISYDVEMREDTVTEWKPLVKDNAKTTYTVSDLEPSKAFVFRVTAKNEYGTSEVSQELTVADRMKDLPPQLVQDAPSISDLEKNSLTLTWPEVKQPKHAKPSETTYNVEVKENGSKEWKLLAKDLTEPKKEVDGIKPDQSYEYRVKGKNEFGESEPTKPVKVDKRAGPPVMKKEKPEFKEISPDVVELKWKPAEDKKDFIKSTITYTVEFKDEAEKDFKSLSTSLEKPMYTANDLDPCISYTFKVTAQNEYGKSDISAELTIPARQVKVGPEMPDEAPKVSKLEKDSCTLTWPEAKLPKNAKPSPLTYILEVKVNGSKDWKELAKDLKDPKYNVKNVKPDQEYEYRVLAKNEFGTSKPSKSVKVDKRAGPPVLPKDAPEFKEIRPEVIELKWKKAEDQKGFVKSTITYIVECREEKAKEWQKLAEGIEKPTYKASDLTPSKAYTFRVTAKNEFGNTEPTKEVLVPKRLIPKPPVMTKDAPKTSKLEKDSVELGWSAATLPEDAKPSPSTYTVEIKEGDSKDWKPVAKDLSETTHKIKDIKPDKDYEIRVVAKNEFGNSEPTKALKIEKRAGPPMLPKDAPKYKEIKPEVIELSWQPAKTQKGFLESPVTYQVEKKSEKDKKWTTVGKDVKDVTFKAKDLDPSLAYEFKVTAKNEYGASEPTNELTVEARLKKVAPAMPKGEPKVTGLDTESPTLAWSPAKQEEDTKPAPVTYKIEAKDGEHGDWKVIAKDLKDPKHKLKDLKPDQEYEVRVVAENEFGLSEPTKAIKIEKRAGPPTLPKDAPTLSDLNKDNPTLKWSPAQTKEGAINSPITYTVEAKEKGTDKWKVIAKDLKDPKCVLKDLKPEKGYEIKVAAKNKFGGSETTQPVILEERTGPPSLPLDAPKLSALDKDAPKLSWSAATTKEGKLDVPITYIIEAKENDSKDWKTFAKDVKDTQHSLKGLVPDKRCEFRVSAVNKFGTSEATKPVILKERLKKDEQKDKSKKDDEKVKNEDDKDKKDEAKVKKGDDEAKKDDGKAKEDDDTAKNDDSKAKKDDDKAKKDEAKVKKDDDKVKKDDDKAKKNDDKAKKDDDRAKKDDDKAKKDDDKAKKDEDKVKKDENKAKKDEDKAKKDDDKAKKDEAKVEKDEDKVKKDEDKAKKDEDKAKKDDDKAKKDEAKVEKDEDKVKKDEDKAKKDEAKVKKDDDKAKKDEAKVKKDDDTAKKDDDKAKKDDVKTKKDDDKVKKDDDKVKKDEDKVKKDEDKAKKDDDKAKKYEDKAKKDEDKVKKDEDKVKKDEDKAKKDEAKVKKDEDKAKKDEGKAKKDDDKVKKDDDKTNKDEAKVKKDDDKVKKDEDKAKKDEDKAKKNEAKVKKDDDKVKKDEDKAKKDDDRVKKDEDRAKKDDDKAKKYEDKAKKDGDIVEKGVDEVKKDDKKAKKGDVKTKKDDSKVKKDDDKVKKDEAKKDDDEAKKDGDKVEKGDDKVKKSGTGAPVLPPDAPTISNLEKDSPKLTWSAAKAKEGTVESPVTYAVELKEWGKDWKVVAKDIKDTKHTLKGLKPDMAYEVRVAAKNKYGESDPTKPAKIPKKKVPPVMSPEHPKISYLEADSLTLTWKEASQQEYAIPSKISYVVEEKVGAKGDWKEIGKDIPKATFRVKGLHPDEDCAYRIIAKNEFGKSDPTKHIILPMQTDEVDSAGPPPDLTPIDPKVKKINDEEVELSWDTPKDAEGQRLFTPLIYDIDFKEEEVEDWKPLVRGVADTTYKATDMEPKKSYEFRVVPQVFQGFGDPWAEIVVPKRSVDQQKQKDAATAKAKGQERGVPPRLQFEAPKISDLQKSSLKLSWDEATLPPGAKKVPTVYIIEIKEGLGQGWKTLTDKVKDTQYNVKDIRADKEFSFRVLAKNEFGVSEPTLPATLNSRGGPPEMPFSKPKYTEVGPETVGLSWEPATNMKGMEDVPITYVIEMREPPTPDWETLVKNVKKTKVAIQDLDPSKSFSFRILAENEYGVSEPTMPLTLPKRDAQYTPEEVRKPNYSLPSKSSVDITWKPSRMPVGCPDMPIVYDVEQCEYPSYDWANVGKGVKGCEYTAKDLKPEKDYMYRVIARTKYGAADSSPPVTARRKGGNLVPQHVKLAKPLVKAVGDDGAELTWRPAENPSNITCPVTYVIEQREAMTSSWKEVAAGVKDVKHVAEGLDPNKDYDFKVVPENEFGRADPYPIATLNRDGSRGKPPAGILITPSFSELGPDAVQLSWLPNKSNDPTQVTYVIEQRMLSGDWKQIANAVPDTYHNLHEVAPDVELVYRVFVKNSFGTSPPSPIVTVRRKAYSNMPEPIREKPTVTDIGPAAIQLSWYPPLRRTNTPLTYVVEEKNPAGGDWRVIATDLEDTRLDIEDLVAGRDNMYRVVVVNEHGKSEPSPAVMAHHQNLDGSKPDAIVEKPVITELGDGRYKLSWVIPREPQSPQDYTLEVRESPSLRWQMVTTGIHDTNYIIENLKPETDYMYRVIVENDYGESDPSPAVSLRQGPESYAPVMPREKPYPREMGPDTILLSWKPAHIPAEAAASEITYTIEVREPPDTEWRKLYTKVPDVSHRMTDLMPKQDYMFRVLAQNEYGLSEPTPPCTVNRKSSKCIPEPILNHPRKTLVGPDAVQLTWPPPYQPAHLANIPMSYIIEVRDGLGSDWRPIAKDIKDPNYTVSGLRPDLGYGFRVRVANEYGVSEPSPVVSLPTKWASDYIPRTPPDCPEITEVSIETVRVSWNAVRPPPSVPGTKVTYILEMREGKSTVWRPMVKGHPETSVLMKDVSPEHEYSFRVRAQNEYGISDPSRHATLPKRFALPEAILEKPFLLELGPDTAKISWRAPRLPTSLSRYQAKPYTYIIEVRDQSGNEWRKLAGDIRDTSYVIKDLLPDRDYLYRVRAQNEYGVSDPSLPVMKYRKADTGRGSASPAYTRKYLGPGFHRGHAAPEFVGDYDDTVYGVKEQPVKISCTISGYPEPKLMWYKDGEKLELGGRFNVYVTANGLCTLEIDAMQKSDVGTYKIFAENTEGTATRYIRLELADPPVFLEPLKDLNLRVWTAGRMECRVDGLPYPEVKFFKDWHPLAHSARVKVKHTEYDYWSLDIDGAISRDEGMFICVAENIAGKVHCTASLHIEEKPPLVDIEIKLSNVSDVYHVLEEIGRGSCGVVRRVIEKCTHNVFAAKFLRARDKDHRNDLKQEFDAMAELSHPHIELLHDAFESNKKLVLVLELITGPELLDHLTELDSITENDIAFYIKQLLEAVEYIHSKGVLHLDIKPENLYFTKHGSTDIKLIDFGCARKTYHERETRINYGTPEFVAPEVVKGEPVTFATDCWHIGVLTYILLSGISPFHDSNDRQTLTNVRECRWSFKNQAFDDITDVAKNFIASLLDIDPRGRPTASDCLNHPFIRLADHRGQGLRLPVDRLKIYSTRRKFERQLNLVRTIVYQRPITSILQDVPRIMLPGDADISKDRAPFSPISPSIGGPQGLLPPLACGIVLTPGTSRASSIAPSDDNTSSFDSGDFDFDLDDEGECPMEDWAGHYHPGAHTHCHHHDESKLKELKEKLHRTELDEKFAAVEAYIYKRSRSDRQKPKKIRKSKIAGGEPLVFKENLHDKGFNVGQNITVSCQVHGNPAPSIHWYRNEEPLWDGHRLRTSYDHHTGRASLTVINTLPTDGGIYKCTARNPLGRIVTKARLAIGDHPTRPGRPVVTAVSSHEVFVMWEEPKTDGNGHILSYRLDYRKAGAREWTLGTHTINECALIQGLEPDSVYRFRANCVNKFGTSPYSFGSIEIRTKHEGAEPIPIDTETRRVLLRSRDEAEDSEPESPDVSRRSSMYEVMEPKKEGLETDIILQEGDPEKFYTFGAQIWSGEHATVVKCSDRNLGKEYIAKIRLKRSEDALREYNILKGLRQERICQLFEAYQTANKVTLILEPLSGEELIRGLCFKNKYTEETVCHVIRQLLDALQFLHNYGIVHLNIEPSNIMMISRRRHDIKIVDFSCARNITHEDGESFGKTEGMTEFFAPEMLSNEMIGCPADVWSVGVVTFVLLSGESPFLGEKEQDTISNISRLRYDAHHLHDNITKDALRFMYHIIKRSPRDRLTIEEALDHRWLNLADPMVKKRRAGIFDTSKLRNFQIEFQNRRFAKSGSTGSETSGAASTEGEGHDERRDSATGAAGGLAPPQAGGSGEPSRKL